MSGLNRCSGTSCGSTGGERGPWQCCSICGGSAVSVAWQARDVVTWPASASLKPGAVAQLMC